MQQSEYVTFESLGELANHIIEQNHEIEIPEPFFYDDESTAACDRCGARLTIVYSSEGSTTSGTLSADVEKRLLEKCNPLPTQLFSWDMEDDIESELNEQGEDEEFPL